MNEKRMRKIRIILSLVFLWGIMVITIPVISGSAYTYLCEDDFSFEGGAKDLFEKYGSSLVGALVRTCEYYKTNQGTYSFTFLIHVIRAYSRGGLVGFHLYMIANCLLFILSLMYLVKCIVEDQVSTLGISFAAFLMIFVMHGTQAGRELFFWYTGSINYALGLSLSFLALAMLLNYKKNTGKHSFLVISCVLAFIASGTSLNIVACNCAWLLTFIIIILLEKIGLKWQYFLPFEVALIGAIINVAAPGNYVRAGEVESDGHVTFWDAIRDTFTIVVSEDKVFFSSLVFMIGMLVVFAVCVGFKVRIVKSGMSVAFLLVALAGTWLIRYFSLFPMAYGYHVDHLANMRMTFSYDLVAKLMHILFAVFLAQYMWERCEKIDKRTLIYVPLCMACVSVMVSIFGYDKVKSELKDSMSYEVLNDFRTGAMLETYAVRAYALSYFELAEEGSDAILYIPAYNKASSTYGMGITVDSEWFVNRSAANLFDLHTTTIIYAE